MSTVLQRLVAWRDRACLDMGAKMDRYLTTNAARDLYETLRAAVPLVQEWRRIPTYAGIPGKLDLEGLPIGEKFDVLAVIWYASSGEFTYKRFPDCYVMQDKAAGSPVVLHGPNPAWRPVAWMPLPPLVPPTAET